jgi:hypothetical protein
MSANATARLLSPVLDRFGVDPEVQRKLPSVMDRMELVCARCPSQMRCRRALAERSPKSSWWDFCPNAAALESVHVIGH